MFREKFRKADAYIIFRALRNFLPGNFSGYETRGSVKPEYVRIYLDNRRLNSRQRADIFPILRNKSFVTDR